MDLGKFQTSKMPQPQEKRDSGRCHIFFQFPGDLQERLLNDVRRIHAALQTATSIWSEKFDDNYLNKLYQVVPGAPHDYGWRRSTWTRELLVAMLLRLTGVRIHVATMSWALAQIKARRGRPRPQV
jgi:hypothetical protein